MTWITRTLISLLLIYIGIMVVAFLAQRKLMYFPSDVYVEPPAGWVEITGAAGTLGWHSAAQEGQPTVMVFHGNASTIASNIHIFQDLQAAGYGVWSVGYPGYPGNAGPPTQARLNAAALDQYKTLKETGAEKIIFYGTSLGAAVAAQLAAKENPEHLILDAPFNSMLDMTRLRMPVLPTRILLKDRWQSGHALKGLNTPLTWIHGTEDNVVPIAQGQKLYDSYAGPKSAHVLLGAQHTNTWQYGGREIVLDVLENY